MLFVNTITYIHVLVCTYIRGGIYVSMSSHAVRNHAQSHVIGKIGLRSPAAECVRCCFLTPKSNAYVLYIIYVCVCAAWWYLYRELNSVSVCIAQKHVIDCTPVCVSSQRSPVGIFPWERSARVDHPILISGYRTNQSPVETTREGKGEEGKWEGTGRGRGEGGIKILDDVCVIHISSVVIRLTIRSVSVSRFSISTILFPLWRRNNIHTYMYTKLCRNFHTGTSLRTKEGLPHFSCVQYYAETCIYTGTMWMHWLLHNLTS